MQVVRRLPGRRCNVGVAFPGRGRGLGGVDAIERHGPATVTRIAEPP